MTFELSPDMIKLAQIVSTKEYWNKHFVVDGDDCRYKDFWDVVEDASLNGAVTVTITDEDEVIFA